MTIGHVEIYLANKSAVANERLEYQHSQTLDDVPEHKSVSNSSNGNVHANFEIGFDGSLPFMDTKPVHEDIAIAALIQSKLHFPKGTTYNNLNQAQWEFMRGLVWNDDPSCLLFKDIPQSNSDYDSFGEEFGLAFKYGPDNCLTRRSHFGDLQFLHSMSPNPNENPNNTKADLLVWMKVMYKLAIGQDIGENDRLDQTLPSKFSGTSIPKGDSCLRDLFLGNKTAFRRFNIQKRAIGSCLHMIQDSYAVGHTLRRLRNPTDLDGRDKNGKFELLK
jgi:hypothetical protein